MSRKIKGCPLKRCNQGSEPSVVMVLIKESCAEVIYFIFKWPDFPSLLFWRLNLEQLEGGHKMFMENRQVKKYSFNKKTSHFLKLLLGFDGTH